MSSGTTYASSGVDIDAATEFVSMIKERIASAWPDAAEEIGGFAGGGIIPTGKRKFCGGIDGTGTKIILAALTENFTGIGQDAVAMSAVDTYIETGTTPEAIWNVLNVASLDPDLHIQVIDSIIAACQMVGCKLIGGETAELPDMFPYSWMTNLDVFALSLPPEKNSYPEIKAGQRIWGWPSHGPASNGFSLLRKIFRLRPRHQAIALLEDLFRKKGAYTDVRKRLDRYHYELGKTLGEALLVPTPIWIEQIEEERKRGVKFSGHAHITGGGLIDNLPRILPADCKAVIDLSTWTRPPIFHLAQITGNVKPTEMLRTFNNGIMVASVVSRVGRKPSCTNAFPIGTVNKRSKDEHQVQFVNEFKDEWASSCT